MWNIWPHPQHSNRVYFRIVLKRGPMPSGKTWGGEGGGGNPIVKVGKANFKGGGGKTTLPPWNKPCILLPRTIAWKLKRSKTNNFRRGELVWYMYYNTHWPTRHALTRRLSVVVDDWMEEVALVCFNRVTSHSVLTQYIITADDNKITCTIISDYHNSLWGGVVSLT